MHKRKTQIICTLGPASDSLLELTRLIESGMNIARLNFSHGTYKHHTKILSNLRAAANKLDVKIKILGDLQGPKIRIGAMKAPTKVKKDQIVTIPLKVPETTKSLRLGQRVLADDGLVEFVITAKLKTSIKCRALNAGTIKSGNGLNFPDSNIKLPALTKKDLQDLNFILEQKLDFIALSFVKTASDIEELRKLIKKSKHRPRIIAKIERHDALDNLKSILKAADGAMIARGDLGVDIPQEQVPIAQKRIATLSRKMKKPFILATQVLQSMIKNARATRAEISDAANAVFEHADAIMLSAETATGRYPFRACETLHRVASAIEQEILKHPELGKLTKSRL